MRGLTGDRESSQKTFEAWFKPSQSLGGRESILEEYLQFVRAHGRAPRQRAVEQAERVHEHTQLVLDDPFPQPLGEAHQLARGVDVDQPLHLIVVRAPDARLPCLVVAALDRRRRAVLLRFSSADRDSELLELLFYAFLVSYKCTPKRVSVCSALLVRFSRQKSGCAPKRRSGNLRAERRADPVAVVRLGIHFSGIGARPQGGRR